MAKLGKLEGFPLILFKGKNVARPACWRFKNSMAAAATLSFSTTILPNLAPAEVSNAN